jgi:hypothetical protein
MNNLFINYFENEYIKITLYKNKFKDKFSIVYYIDTELLEINRIDIDLINGGWGQDLKLLVYNKIKRIENIVNIGSSKKNSLSINYSINKEEIINNLNHFENENYKIYHISEFFNDTFKIKYNENDKLITVKRIDSNEGWGDNLKLVFIEKNNNKFYVIPIGPSNKNNLIFNLGEYFNKLNLSISMNKKELNKISLNNEISSNNLNINNYFDYENYTISLYDFKHNDIFNIKYYEESETIYIKRLDSNEGWGANLMLNIFDKINSKHFTIHIGSSSINEIYRKINLIDRKVYVVLTTIPSRIKLPEFFYNIQHLINTQTYPIEKVFITIAEKYKRFTESISIEIIEKLKEIEKVEVITITDDLGPASKYLAPLLHKFDELEDNIMVVIDDDRYYNKNLIRNFITGYNSYPNIIFSSGLWKEYFNKNYQNIDEEYINMYIFKENNVSKFYFGQGLGGFFGFAIRVHELESFIEYNLKILKKLPKSFYHDEGIILGYLKYKEEDILYLNHKGCNYIDDEMVDALCKSNLVDRGHIEKEILQVTNLERLL